MQRIKVAGGGRLLTGGNSPKQKRKIIPNISSALLLFKDDEGHQSDHHCCQDGAVDRDEFLVQTVVLLGLAFSVGGGGSCCGAVHRNLGWDGH